MRYARLVDDKVVEIVRFDPESRFPADWVWVECPENIIQGADYDASKPVKDRFTNPVTVESVDGEDTSQPTHRTTVTRVEFKNLFPIAVRVAIRQARHYTGDNPDALMLKYTLDEAYDVLDDPQLTEVHLDSHPMQEFLNAVVGAGLMTQDQRDTIAKGVVL